MRVGSALAICLASSLTVFALASAPLAAPLMVEKNLFAQDRKPPSGESSPTTQQTNKPALPPKSFQLDGVFILGDTKKALLRIKGQLPGEEKRKGNSPYVSVREGDKIGGYEVTRIESRSVFLQREGQTYEVRLFAEGKIVPPPPATPAAPGGPDATAGVGRPGGQPPAMPGAHAPVPPPVGQPPDAHYTGGAQRVPPNMPAEPIPPPGAEQEPGVDTGVDEEVDDSEILPEDEQALEEDIAEEMETE